MQNLTDHISNLFHNPNKAGLFEGSISEGGQFETLFIFHEELVKKSEKLTKIAKIL